MIVEHMKKLGFTSYEIKAYLALLGNHPINGYGLSKSSTIPRSRIYEVVDGLIEKGAVFEHTINDARVYTPLEPNLLINKLKNEYNKVLDEVKNYTETLYNSSVEKYEVKEIHGRDAIIDHLKVLIKTAKKRIAVSIWHEELEDIEDELRACLTRNVMLRGIYFGHNNLFESLITHRRINRYKAEKDSRYIILIIDNTDVVSGKISTDKLSRILWSKDPSEIDMKDDFIAHDVMINQYALISNTPDDYEKTLDQIRKEYFCYSDEAYKSFIDT